MMKSSIRVSILERLVPSFAFAVAAISGAIGGVMIFRFLSSMRQAEMAGYAAFFGGVSEIELVVGGVLTFAAMLCAIGILVSIIRLFTTNTKASPSGLLFLITGLLSIVPPFAIHYLLHTMKEVVRSPDPAAAGGISSIAGTITGLSYFAIGFAVVMLIVLIAFTFIPLSSSAGRKASPLICLMIIEILIATLAGIYFWEARGSLKARYTSQTAVDESIRDASDANIDDPNAKSDVVGESNYTTDTNSSAGSRTISGGVLNAKAIDFPQPAYPPAARAVRATGSVSVQVLIDEKGEVISAAAVSGHPLLRAAAVQAARQARFGPTKLSGQPVKMSGVLTYSFSEQ